MEKFGFAMSPANDSDERPRFRNLTDEQLTTLVVNAAMSVRNQGDCIVRQGDRADMSARAFQ